MARGKMSRGSRSYDSRWIGIYNDVGCMSIGVGG